MNADSQPSISRAAVWTGHVIGTLPALLLVADGAAKLFRPEPVVKATTELGYPENVIVPLGCVLLICALLYLLPRMAVLGAILLTGYLGGAVATHVRAGHPLFEIMFPVFFGALLWGGLVLRDSRLRTFLPVRRSREPAPSEKAEHV